jgi:CHAD domain-containing protein
MTGYIRESQEILKKSEIPGEEAVHDIRVLMKKCRAVLKLIGNQTDNPFYGKDKNDLREVGRILCCFRDSSVYRKTLKEFRKDYPDIFSRLQTCEKLSQLLEKTKPDEELSEKTKSSFKQIELLLNKTSYRIRFQSMQMFDPQLMLKELEFTYVMVAELYLRSRNNPKPELIHKFRKKTKEFLYQLYIFKSLNPPVIKTLEKKLANLAMNLGKFNDLSQIIKVLGYKYHKGTNQPALDELILKIREKQDIYMTRIWTSSYEIFCPGQKLVNVLGFKLLII